MAVFEVEDELNAGLLPKRQRDVLKLISSLTEEHGYPPTLAELAKAMGLRNRMTVHQHVQALKRKGFVHWEPGLNRSLTVVNTSVPKEAKRPFKQSVALPKEDRAPRGLPLAGTIAAGQPIDALQTSDYLEMDGHFADSNCFALKVKGDSMIEDGILDGDYVIVKPNPSPKNGDVVVALLSDGVATLKRFFKEKGRFKLKPSNCELQPIFVEPDEELIIQGVVVGLFRKL